MRSLQNSDKYYIPYINMIIRSFSKMTSEEFHTAAMEYGKMYTLSFPQRRLKTRDRQSFCLE